MNVKAAAIRRRREHKYHARAVARCVHCGQRHPSQVEAARCAHLHLLIKAGDIQHVDVHPSVSLPGGTYRPDFGVWPWGAGRPTYEEVKGILTAVFVRIRREFDRVHPAAPLRVIRGRRTKTGWTWREI